MTWKAGMRRFYVDTVFDEPLEDSAELAVDLQKQLAVDLSALDEKLRNTEWVLNNRA